MSLMGQSRRFDRVPTTSATPLQADIVTVRRHVSKVPRTEVSIPSAATVASEARHGGVRLAPPLALDLNEVDDLGPSASKLSEIGYV